MSDHSSKRPDQAVPLVIYKGGERIIIGSAYLKGDGSIEAQIAKDVREDLKDLLFKEGLVGDISINPKVTSRLVDLKSKEIEELRYVPPLKLKES